mgnify:CR=1 FL=1
MRKPSRFPLGLAAPSVQFDVCVQSDTFVHRGSPVWVAYPGHTQTAVCHIPAENADFRPHCLDIGPGTRASRTPCPYDAYTDEFQCVLDAPVPLMGFDLPAEDAHAGDERMSPENFPRGIVAAASLRDEVDATFAYGR